jgi:Ca2+-binding EF-hand superfamily protein
MLKKIALGLAFTGLIAGGVALADKDGGGSKHEEMLKKYDTNGDGKLDDAEKAQMKADREARFAEKKKEMLAKYDANGDGKLDDGERAQMRADMAAERFKKLDTNGDGVLSKDEFAAGFKGGHGHRGHHHHG